MRCQPWPVQHSFWNSAQSQQPGARPISVLPIGFSAVGFSVISCGRVTGRVTLTKRQINQQNQRFVAEREGFEPTGTARVVDTLTSKAGMADRTNINEAGLYPPTHNGL